MNFINKAVLITGASRGIGKKLALDLAAGGANLGLVARNADALEEVKEAAEKLGVKVLTFAGSVSDEQFVNQVVAKMTASFDQLDYLINNAGYGVFGPTESYSAETWSDLYDTNVKGTFLFCKAALAPMKKAGSGHIINIASDVAKRVFDGGALYCSSKFAQDAFSGALRKEVRSHGIKVSVVYSGLVDTDFHPDPHAPEKADWLSAENMSTNIRFVMAQPAHVVIDELMIHPLSQEY